MAVAFGQLAVPQTVFGGAGALFTKAAWSDDEWTYQPDLRFLRATAAVAGHDLGRLEVEADYGTVLRAGATALTTRVPSDLIGHWVRLDLIGPQGLQTVWTGRIDAERRTILGGTGANRVGRQRWVAYAPLRILQKRTISTSWWWEQGAAVEIDWMPAFNHRNEQRLIFGNATDTEEGASHLFGGNSIWTHLMILEYVVERFVQEAEEDDEDEGVKAGPQWTLGGELDVLERISDAIPVGDSITAAALIAKIIPRRLGLAWDIVPTPDGFEIRVFPLLAKAYTFGGVELPANPNRFTVTTAGSRDWRIDLVDTTDQVYDRIEIRGKRMVVCCTIAGANAPVVHTGGLVPKWTSTQKTQYDDPFPGNPFPGREIDEARKVDHLASVYRLFGLPDNWDFNAGTAVPTVKDDGTVDKDTPSTKKQTSVRATLSWLPLYRDYNYRSDPPTVENVATQFTGELVPPTVWVKDLDTGRYALADEVGISVSVTKQTLGVYLEPDTMAHVLGKNHITFDDGPASGTVPAKYDYDDLIATLAFESDVRSGIVLERDGATPSGGVLTIDVDAELWYLAPNTVVRVTAGANASVFQTAAGAILRDDFDDLKLVAAGAIARYWERRRRGSITLQGLQPVDLLGRVLVVDDGGEAPALESPVTSVEWVAPANESEGPRSVAAESGPLTIVHTGYGQ